MRLLSHGKPEGSAAGYAGSEHAIINYDYRYGTVIDLGLAASPIGPAPELVSILNRNVLETTQALVEYSEDAYHTSTKETLLEGIGLNGVDSSSVIFHPNGSYGAGDEIIRHLATRGYSTLLAPAYSFPNTSQWATRNRVEYKPLPGDTLDPSSSLEAVLMMGKRDLSKKIVYIDYPNNPTGVTNPDLMRAVVDHVSQRGGIPIVDLAFGEILGDEFRDAMQFTLDHGGIVLSSLSKTQGLPNLRAGYAIMSKIVTANYSDSERLVFGLPPDAELAYQTLYALQPDGSTLAKTQAHRAAEYNIQTNRELMQGLENLGLRVASTDLRVPIQAVISDDPNFYEKLAAHGIKAESLVEYRGTLNLRRTKRGYGNKAVRMLTPKPGQVHEVLKRIELALL